MSLRDIFEKQTGLDSYDVCKEYYTKEYVEWLENLREEKVVNVPQADNVQPLLCDVNPQRKTMSIEELRNQFEHEYLSRMFSLERDENGQYIKTTTFQAWCAYKLCALLNGVLPEGFDIISKAAD